MEVLVEALHFHPQQVVQEAPHLPIYCLLLLVWEAHHQVSLEPL
jgi:hypothetical protein